MSTEVTVVDRVCQALASDAMQARIRQALPPDVSIDRFTRTTLVALQTKPEIIQNCETQSVYNAILRAAQDGLLPDGREGALVEFSVNVGTKDNPKWVKKAQWMPMVYGIIQMLGKAGIDAHAACVYEGEDVEVWSDDIGQHIRHKRNPFGDRGKMIGVYATAKTKSGELYVEPMNMADIDAVRQKSKKPDSGPWQTDLDRMAQKSALHRVAKRVPIDRDDIKERIDNVLKSDEETFDVAAAPREDARVTMPEQKPKALAALVDKPVQEPRVIKTAEKVAATPEKPGDPRDEKQLDDDII